VLLAYFITVIGIGLYKGRGDKTMEGFAVGNRSMPSTVVLFLSARSTVSWAKPFSRTTPTGRPRTATRRTPACLARRRSLPAWPGISSWGPGVYGHRSLIGQDQSSIPNGLAAGVVGTSTNWHGVIGWSTNGNGVEGITFDGEGGVVGVGGQAPGVFGVLVCAGTDGP
jgi:hypothetical protein